MPVSQFTCPSCGKVYNLATALPEGKSVRCAQCATVFKVKAAEAPAQPKPAAPKASQPAKQPAAAPTKKTVPPEPAPKKGPAVKKEAAPLPAEEDPEVEAEAEDDLMVEEEPDITVEEEAPPRKRGKPAGKEKARRPRGNGLILVGGLIGGLLVVLLAVGGGLWALGLFGGPDLGPLPPPQKQEPPAPRVELVDGEAALDVVEIGGQTYPAVKWKVKYRFTQGRPEPGYWYRCEAEDGLENLGNVQTAGEELKPEGVFDQKVAILRAQKPPEGVTFHFSWSRWKEGPYTRVANPIRPSVAGGTGERAGPGSLKHHADATLQTIGRDHDIVASIVFWPDGSKFATGTFVRHIEVWDAKTRIRLHRYPTTGLTPIHQIALSPDGQTLAATGENVVTLWDTATQTVRKTLAGHTGHVSKVAYSPDGNFLAAADDKTVRLWKADGQLGPVITEYTGSLFVLAFSPDSKSLAVAGKDENRKDTVTVWDVGTGKRTGGLKIDDKWITALAYSPDGKQIATGGSDGSVRLWDAATGEPRVTLEERGRDVQALVFTRDGNRLLAGGVGKTLRVWDLPAGTTRLPAWTHDWIHSLAISPDGAMVLTGEGGGKVRFWSMQNLLEGSEASQIMGQEAVSFLVNPRSGPSSLAVSPDGKTLLTNCADGTIGIWDLGSKKELHKARHLTIAALPSAISPDGNLAASGEESDKVRVRKLATGEELFLFEGDGFVTDLVFTPDSKLLLASSGKKVMAWDMTTGKPAFSWDAEEKQLEALELLPGGERIATGGEEKKIKIWDLKTKNLVQTLTGSEGKVLVIRATPDSKKLVSHSFEGKVKVWDLAGGKVVREHDAHNIRIDWLQVLPDGKTVVYPHLKEIVLWDMESGKQRSLVGHLDMVNVVILTPDGKRIISSAGDGTVKIWDP